ncbi:MAG: class I SAM-dependent methyltransferase [Symploca sp. SIO1C2]|nr:class I SAM-dependent methyltransferase [Symploca sp. SIO1C2]
MGKKFTEFDTEKYYNTVETQYQVPWNPDGSKHWGYFDDLDAPDEEEVLFQASDRWDEYMLDQSSINAESRVLDLGCGNGNTALYLAQKTGCEVVGIDISEIHIANAQEKAANFPELNLAFEKASATNLPSKDQHFSHVWSQGTLLHIHERDLALREIHRVLGKSGILLFDDLVALVPQASESTLQYVYDRLHLTELFNPESYVNTLTKVGFKVLEALDLTLHMKKFYDIQAKRVQAQFPERSIAYQKTSEAAVAGEIGWWFYLCQKV